MPEIIACDILPIVPQTRAPSALRVRRSREADRRKPLGDDVEVFELLENSSSKSVTFGFGVDILLICGATRAKARDYTSGVLSNFL